MASILYKYKVYFCPCESFLFSWHNYISPRTGFIIYDYTIASYVASYTAIIKEVSSLKLCNDSNMHVSDVSLFSRHHYNSQLYHLCQITSQSTVRLASQLVVAIVENKLFYADTNLLFCSTHLATVCSYTCTNTCNGGYIIYNININFQCLWLIGHLSMQLTNVFFVIVWVATHVLASYKSNLL